MTKLIGQFLLLVGAKCVNCGDYCNGRIILQFAPQMQADALFDVDDEYMTPDGRTYNISGVMSDEDGFLSWLMTQTVPAQDGETDEFGDEREPISAMQSMGAALQEAYMCGTNDERQRITEEHVKLRSQYQDALDAKQKELGDTINNTVVYVNLMNGRIEAAEKTIAALRVELRTYRPDVDNTEAKPPALAEPQPEPVTVPTNGGSDGSGNGTNGQ